MRGGEQLVVHPQAFLVDPVPTGARLENAIVLDKARDGLGRGGEHPR